MCIILLLVLSLFSNVQTFVVGESICSLDVIIMRCSIHLSMHFKEGQIVA